MAFRSQSSWSRPAAPRTPAASPRSPIRAEARECSEGSAQSAAGRVGLLSPLGFPSSPPACSCARGLRGEYAIGQLVSERKAGGQRRRRTLDSPSSTPWTFRPSSPCSGLPRTRPAGVEFSRMRWRVRRHFRSVLRSFLSSLRVPLPCSPAMIS